MIESKKLDCGVRIVMEEIPYVQSVAMGIFVRAGAIDEVSKYSGVSHFIEHMMFKGTDRRSAKQIAEDVDRIAGNMNAYTSKEHTCYHIKTLSSNVEKAVDIITDMIVNSRFDTVEMNRERNVIFEEMNMIQDTPDDLVYELMTKGAFQNMPLENSIIGTKSSLNRITHNVIKDYIAKEYTKDSIVVSVSGNFDKEQICSLFNEKLAPLPASKKAKIAKKAEYKPMFLGKVKDIEQSHIMMGVPSIPLGDPMYYAQAVVGNAFGGTMSSRLFQKVREEKGLAYSVYCMSSLYSNAGAFMIYAGVSHKNIGKAISAIKDEIKLLKKDCLTQDELEMSKQQLLGNYIYGQENVNGRMLSIGKNLLILNKIFSTEEVIANLNAVTMDDVAKYIDLIGDLSKYSGAVISNHRVRLKEMME